MHTHLEQWAADTAAPGEQLGVQWLAQGFHLSRGQFPPETRFKPTTSGYKSDALSIRATTAPVCVCVSNFLAAQVFYTAEKQYNLHNNRQIFYNLQKNLTENIWFSCLITIIFLNGSMFCPQTKSLAMSLGLGEISSGDTSSPPFLDLKYKYCIRIIPVDVMGFKSLKNNPTMLDKHTIWHLSLEQAGGCAWNYSFWVFSQSPKLRNITSVLCVSKTLHVFPFSFVSVFN